MKLLQWTIFVDMLGYRDINGSINNEENAKKFVAFMKSNKEIFDFSNRPDVKDRYKHDEVFNLYSYYNIQYSFISDSLIMTFSPNDVSEPNEDRLMYLHSSNALFIILMRLQGYIFNCFSTQGIFLRGGISNKYCYIDNEFAVGEGLIDAYKAESKMAVYPRIILHPDILKDTKLHDSINFLAKKMYGGVNIIKKDEDGIYFLDYIGQNLIQTNSSTPSIYTVERKNKLINEYYLKNNDIFLREHSKAIKDKLLELNNRKTKFPEAKGKTQKIIDKFIWLKSYHNNSLINRPEFKKHLID